MDIDSEKNIKNRISKYRNNLPKKETLIELIKDIWNLCKNLENNKYYFNDLQEEVELDNEILLANKKIDFMESLLKKKSFFRKNLKKAFNLIDKDFLNEKVTLTEELKEKEKTYIMKKYSDFNSVDILKIDTYLKNYKE